MHEELLTYCRHFDVSLAVISSPMPEVKLYEHLIGGWPVDATGVRIPLEFA